MSADPENTRDTRIPFETPEVTNTKAGLRWVDEHRVADLPSVPTVELLTRAADAAREAVRRYENRGAGSRFGPDWPSEIRGALGGPVGDLAALGGPDHWRAVEVLLRGMLAEHDRYWRQHQEPEHHCRHGYIACHLVQAARPVAEQVLRDLGDAG